MNNGSQSPRSSAHPGVCSCPTSARVAIRAGMLASRSIFTCRSMNSFRTPFVFLGHEPTMTSVGPNRILTTLAMIIDANRRLHSQPGCECNGDFSSETVFKAQQTHLYLTDLPHFLRFTFFPRFYF